MNNKRLISVIVPIYKVEKYLRRCIDSIINQSYKNLEIILVDDGSPDECPQICEEYAKIDGRIKLIHKSNEGLSEARNDGLKVASGDYIYFMDGDDYMKPHLLFTVLDAAVNNNADVVAFNYISVDEFGNEIGGSCFQAGTYEFQTCKDRMNYIINVLSRYKFGWESWSRLFKADKIKQYHLTFWDNKKIFAEDFGFLLNYMLYAKKMICIKDKLYYYVIRNGSIMRQTDKDLKLSNYIAMCKIWFHEIEGSAENTLMKNEFPALFYSIMEEQLRHISYRDYKRNIDNLVNIDERRYFFKQITSYLCNPGLLFRYTGFMQSAKVIVICIYLLNCRNNILYMLNLPLKLILKIMSYRHEELREVDNEN